MKNFFLSCKEIRIEPSSPPIYYGSFYLGPFENGQALTVANALRRTLLSEIPGLAMTSVKIDGVLHEYSTLKGMRETVLDLLLNLKQIVIKKEFSEPLKETQIGYLQVRGPGIIRAGNLKLPPNFVCIDPDQYIATLNENGYLNLIFTIDEGKNFVFVKNHTNFLNLTQLKDKVHSLNENVLLIDSVFSPIKKVNYTIEVYGSETIDKSNQVIILEIWTNGSISPQNAITQTLNYLRLLFNHLGQLKILQSMSTSYFLRQNEKFRESLTKIDTGYDLIEMKNFQKNKTLNKH